MSVASTTELRADRDGGGAQSTMDLDSNRGAATSLSHLIPTSHSLDREECSVPSELTHRPPNVPQRHAIQAMHARSAGMHVHFF